MIGKISRGADGTGLARYLFGEGKENEHQDQRVIAASEGLEVDQGRALSRDEVLDLGHQLDAPQAVFGTEVKDGHIWHLSLTNPAGDRSLSDAEWSKIAHETMDRLGFTEAPGRAGCPWVAVGHGLSTAGNEHIHIAVSLVREDGSKASIWQDRVKLSEACAAFEREYGLTVVDGRAREGLPGVSRAEDELAARRGRPEAERSTLARHVRAASVGARDEAEFVRRLRAEGVIVRPRYAQGGREQVVGYSVALRPVEPGQDPTWYGGGRLAKDLGLPKLRAHWDQSPDRQAVEAWGTAPPSPGREAVAKGPAAWSKAAGRVEQIGRHLEQLPLAATAGWSGAARETAGVMAQLSVRLEPDRPGPLARAADTLARSAQPYLGEIPGIVRDGPVRDLRGVSGVAGQAQLRPSSGPQVAELVTELSGTVDQLAAAHAARGETLQARHLGQAAAEVAALGVTMAAVGRMIPDDRLISKLIEDEEHRSPTEDDDEPERRRRRSIDTDRGFGR
jgi:hypothetical protein